MSGSTFSLGVFLAANYIEIDPIDGRVNTNDAIKALNAAPWNGEVPYLNIAPGLAPADLDDMGNVISGGEPVYGVALVLAKFTTSSHINDLTAAYPHIRRISDGLHISQRTSLTNWLATKGVITSFLDTDDAQVLAGRVAAVIQGPGFAGFTPGWFV
jgi:hypothetical protein